MLDNTAGYTNTAIVVLTDLSKTGAVELSAIVEGAVKEKSITIKGGGAKTPTLTRIAPEEGSDKNDRVLKVSGGAKIKFENIIINGITDNPDYYHGALAIGEAAVSEEPAPPISRVTLGNGAVITGKKDGISGSTVITKESDAGSGVFIGLYGELVMEQGSKVTGCKTSGGEYAFAPVVAVGGKFIMNGGEISGNEIVCAAGHASGGGVYIGGTSYTGEFTMKGGKISRNTVKGTSAYTDITGGGVYVGGNSASIFNMSKSEISDNTVYNTYTYDQGFPSASGGGVYVDNYCKFEMTDSLISGNKAVASYAASGGGVSVKGGDAEFNMIGGEISGNKTEASQTYGGGVDLHANYDAHPKFTMNGGIIYSKPSDDSDKKGNTAQTGAALSTWNASGQTNYDYNITVYPITE